MTGYCALAGKAGGAASLCLEFFVFLFVSRQKGIKVRGCIEGLN
jgi:hypothetical protein